MNVDTLESLLIEARDELQESIENEGRLASFASLVSRIDAYLATGVDAVSAPRQLVEQAAQMLECHADYGMQHKFTNGADTPNAVQSRQTSVALFNITRATHPLPSLPKEPK